MAFNGSRPRLAGELIISCWTPKSAKIRLFVCNQVAKSREILMFVCLQKDTKQIETMLSQAQLFSLFWPTVVDQNNGYN